MGTIVKKRLHETAEFSILVAIMSFHRIFILMSLVTLPHVTYIVH